MTEKSRRKIGKIRSGPPKAEINFRDLFEQAADSILLIDPATGSILEFNRSAHENLGYTRRQFEKIKLSDIEANESNREIKKHLKKIVKKGLDRFEAKQRMRSGEIRDVFVNCRSILSQNKEYVQSIWHDITDQKRTERLLRENAKKLRSFFDNMKDGVAIYEAVENGKNFVFKDVNKAAEKIDGVKKEDIVGRKVTEVFPGVKKFGLFDKFRKVWKTGRAEYHPATLYKNGEHSGWRENYVYKLPSGMLVAIYSDVTARVEAEKEARFLSSIVAQAQDAVVVTNTDFRITYVNRSAEKLYGYSRKYLVGKSPSVFNGEKDKKQVQEKIYTVLSSGRAWSGRHYNRRKDGSRFFCSMVVSPLVEKGQVTGYIGTMRDISGQKTAEDTLKREQMQLLSIFDSIDAPIYVADLKTYEVLFVNKRMKKMLAKDPTGKKCYSEFQKLDSPCRFCTNSIIKKKKGESYQWEYHNSYLDQDFIVSDRVIKWPDGRDVRFEIAVDITERKKAERDLRISEERFRQISENAREWIWEVDHKGLYTFSSETAKDILGYSRDEIVGKKHFFDFFQSTEQKKLKKDAFETFLRKKPFNNFLNCNLHKNGKVVWLSTSGFPILDKNRKLLGYRGADVDITERVEAEEALRMSEEKYRRLVETANDAIFMADTETGIIIDANKKAGELLGLPLRKIIGMHQSDLHPEKEKQHYRDHFRETVVARGEDKTVSFVRHSSGRSVPVQISANVIELKGKKVMQGIFSDITELKNVEEILKKDKSDLEKLFRDKSLELTQAQRELNDVKRLSDIGALAAVVAHELRNPLGVIETALHNIRKKSKDTSLESHLNNIEKKIFESDRIVKNLLTYSRIKDPVYEKISIRGLLRECVAHCREKFHNSEITFDTKFDREHTFTIEADPIHMAELFSNVLDNAAQSLPGGKGAIHIEASRDARKRQLLVEIRDNGTGIAKEDLVQVFDPFFTRKPRGIGLGLTVCRQVVKLHGGKIVLRSEGNRGTTVTVTLPIKKNNSKTRS